MTWKNATLAASLGDSVAKAEAAIAAAQKSVSVLNSQINKLAGEYTTLLDSVMGNKGMLDKIMDTGMYMIPLTPKLGAWDTRLETAPNNPPNRGYCTGTATIIISANPMELLKSFNSMKAALKKPFDDAAAFLDAGDLADFLPEMPELPELPELTIPDWDALFGLDEWSGASLGDVFGGAAGGLAKASAALKKQALSALSLKNQMGKSLYGLNRGLSQANAFMHDLNATGAYSILLEPGEGGYLSRLRSNAGAPPSDPSMYSAGFVCITLADGLDALASKYNAIKKVTGA